MDPRSDSHHMIISLYQRGLSMRQIAELTGASKTVVGRIVQAAGVTRSRSDAQIAGGRREKAIPSDWGFLPLVPGKAWLLGLIYGDGAVRADRRSVILSTNDPSVRDNVNALFGGKLHAVQHENRWILQINSVRLTRELHDVFRLAPGDSGQRTFPLLNPSLLAHFARGLFDSDGRWYLVTTPRSSADGSTGVVPGPGPGPGIDGGVPEHRRLRLEFSASSYHLVTGLEEALVTHAAVSDHVRLRPEPRGAWTLECGSRSAVEIGRWIYQDSTPSIRREAYYTRWKTIADPNGDA